MYKIYIGSLSPFRNMCFDSSRISRLPRVSLPRRKLSALNELTAVAFRRTFHSNFKIHVLPRRAQPFICLRLSAIWNDQCFTSTRPARGRSLIKLLKDFRRWPRRAAPHCDSWIQNELPVLPCALSRSLSLSLTYPPILSVARLLSIPHPAFS